MENTSEKKYLTLIQKVGYGVGDLGSNYCWTFVASFIMIYCTNTLGIRSGVIGVIMMLSKFLDGVSDVIMGRIIDRTKSKMGKARFWYALSAFPVAFFTFLLFNVPSGFTKNTQYVYIFIAYTLMGVVFYTMSNIAYSSLTALVTKNQKERVQLGSYRFIFAGLAVILIGTFTSDLVEYFGGGQHGWTIVSLIYSLICFVFLFIPVLAVKELSDSELMESGNETEKENKIGFIESVMLLFKNKYFIMLLVWYLVMYLASGVTSGLGIYYTTYKLNNAGLLGTLSMVGMIPAMIILLFVPQLTEKFGIRRVSIWGAVFGIAGGILALIGGNTEFCFIAIVIGLVGKSAGSAPMRGGVNALIAAADDYSALKFGKRVTGMMYSCSSVGLKVGTGFGTAVTGILLEFAKFNGTTEAQSAFTVNVINYGYILAVVIPSVVTLLVLVFLNVEKENKRMRELGKK